MSEKSGMAQAGEILLLVGAILAVVSTFFVLVYGLFMGVLLNRVSDDAPFAATGVMVVLFVLIGLMSAIGSVCGFIGWNKARHGDYNAGFGFGLACALLPPLQVVPLLGAIFCKIAPEAQDPAL